MYPLQQAICISAWATVGPLLLVSACSLSPGPNTSQKNNQTKKFSDFPSADAALVAIDDIPITSLSPEVFVPTLESASDQIAEQSGESEQARQQFRRAVEAPLTLLSPSNAHFWFNHMQAIARNSLENQGAAFFLETASDYFLVRTYAVGGFYRASIQSLLSYVNIPLPNGIDDDMQVPSDAAVLDELIGARLNLMLLEELSTLELGCLADNRPRRNRAGLRSSDYIEATFELLALRRFLGAEPNAEGRGAYDDIILFSDASITLDREQLKLLLYLEQRAEDKIDVLLKAYVGLFDLGHQFAGSLTQYIDKALPLDAIRDRYLSHIRKETEQHEFLKETLDVHKSEVFFRFLIEKRQANVEDANIDPAVYTFRAGSEADYQAILNGFLNKLGLDADAQPQDMADQYVQQMRSHIEDITADLEKL